MEALMTELKKFQVHLFPFVLQIQVQLTEIAFKLINLILFLFLNSRRLCVKYSPCNETVADCASRLLAWNRNEANEA